jgi:hypothetical protein
VAKVDEVAAAVKVAANKVVAMKAAKEVMVSGGGCGRDEDYRLGGCSGEDHQGRSGSPSSGSMSAHTPPLPSPGRSPLPPAASSITQHSPFIDNSGRLQSVPIYKTMARTTPSFYAFTNFIWKNCAPPRVCFFTWFLVQQKINCKANLYRKSIIEDPICGLCRECNETTDHLIFVCKFVCDFWASVGVHLPPSSLVSTPWGIQRPSTIHAVHFSM